ncbi:MAG: M20 family metallo-hydrolase [Bacteroidaceae bacterium]|nr:M20 family metallo-hydrolase [Bacteroidaceae bacterium]
MNIESLTSDAVKLLCQLIVIPRFSREETQAADMLEQVMSSEYGFDVNREGNNLWCVHPDYQPNRSTLLLNAHIDTVKPTAAWTRNPYEASIEDGIIYGLGSNDDGASLVSLIQVFRVLSQKKMSYNLILALSAEEEVSGKNGMEHLLTVMPKIDVALVGEPTGMHPAIAEKGLMVLDLTAHGKAGHAARNEGDNAIYHAMDDIAWFRNYQFPKQSELLGPVKMSVTIVNAGTQHNVVPAECTFTVDVRSNECYSNEELFSIISQNVKSEVKARSFRLSSSGIDVNHPLVQRAVALGRKPFGSPTLSDQALMRFPSFKMGPGESPRSHTANEFVKIDEIREAISIYLNMLDAPLNLIS